jgi:hypothetical protein
LTVTLSQPQTTIETGKLSSGVYMYKITGNNKVLQSGRLTSNQ